MFGDIAILLDGLGLFGNRIVLHLFVNVLIHIVVKQILLMAEYLIDILVVSGSRVD